MDARRPGSEGIARGLLWREVPGAKVADLLNGLAFPPEGADVDGRRMAEYIRRQMRLSELRRWTVLVPSGTGAPVNVIGKSMPTVKRTPLADRSSPTRFVVKSILSRVDEAVDLSDGQYARALTETNRVLDEQGKTHVDRPSGPWIRQIRGDDPDRGLLIVYPLDPQAGPESKTPLYGVVVSFPTSKTATAEDRLDNTVRQREVM